MRVLTNVVAVLVMTAFCDAGAPRSAREMPAETRNAFLNRVDAAFASGDPRAILALADVDGWRESGRPAPDPSALTLPTPSLKRLRPLSETDILYADGAGRQWRLSLRGDDARGWSVTLRDRPCPATSGMPRGLDYQRPAQRGAQEAAGGWTPLECWPLPK
jgi:hypothetical protein